MLGTLIAAYCGTSFALVTFCLSKWGRPRTSEEWRGFLVVLLAWPICIDLIIRP